MSHTIECYSLIKEPALLEQFVTYVLKPLDQDQAYYVALFARQKYSNTKLDLSANSKISNFLIYDTKDLVKELRKREVQLGLYTDRSGNAIDEDVIAVYINPNPRNLRKGAFNFGSHLFKIADSHDQSVTFKPGSLLLSEIHKSPITPKNYLIFDIDSLEQSTLDSIIDITESRSRILKTRGGYHVMIDYTDADNQRWLKSKKDGLKSLVELADQHGDLMVPIPGCRQGDFVPYFLTQLGQERVL